MWDCTLLYKSESDKIARLSCSLRSLNTLCVFCILYLALCLNVSPSHVQSRRTVTAYLCPLYILVFVLCPCLRYMIYMPIRMLCADVLLGSAEITNWPMSILTWFLITCHGICKSYNSNNIINHISVYIFQITSNFWA